VGVIGLHSSSLASRSTLLPQDSSSLQAVLLSACTLLELRRHTAIKMQPHLRKPSFATLATSPAYTQLTFTLESRCYICNNSTVLDFLLRALICPKPSVATFACPSSPKGRYNFHWHVPRRAAMRNSRPNICSFSVCDSYRVRMRAAND
jgi:hypothetical protein